MISLSAVLECAHEVSGTYGEDYVRETLADTFVEQTSAEGPLLFHLDAALDDDEFDESIFDSFVSHPRVDTIIFTKSADARAIPRLIRRALPLLEEEGANIAFHSFPMKEPNASEIFAAIDSCGVDFTLFMYVTEDDQVMNTFAKHIAAADHLTRLHVVRTDARRVGLPTHESFDSVYTALGEAPRLRTLILNAKLVSEVDLEAATESLAKSIASSKSVENVAVKCDSTETGAFSMDQVCHGLARTEAVQNFCLCYDREHDNDANAELLALYRSNPWKPLLSKDVPLNLWPFVLDKASGWNPYDSHGPLDALYFLIKEKPTVLLQNVKRRRIRNRKCHHVEG